MGIETDESLMSIYFVSLVAMGIMITIIGNCLCCRRNKTQKDEFSGVEGMVKIKNLDDGDFASNLNLNANNGNNANVIELKLHGTDQNVSQNEFSGVEGMVKIKNLDDGDFASNLNLNANNGNNANVIELKLHGTDQNVSQSNNHEMKRVANAPHRSLPDLPAEIGDVGGDNNSDLYATVGDKTQQKINEKSPTTLKKQTSISQHSSISQADEFSSPYARVRSPPHAYDKVKRAEHPYAQVGSQPIRDQSLDETDGENSMSQRQSNSSLAEADGTTQRQEIPAASAIAGRISASQDLPYMTPPIVQPQLHFSGDSQDSSKGYTSISVREPLANIIAMTNEQNAQRKRRDMSDSHYATVSDDSDEMYAAIDDPNQVDLYTSGSETYAQIQPLSNQMTVSVEINTTQQTAQEVAQMTSTSLNSSIIQPNSSVLNNESATGNPTPLPPSIDSLKTNLHSRQASASSCSSALGYIGSPKPEKRQANSPLPPTPKSLHKSSTSNLTSGSSTVTSGRNSAASVIEVSNVVGIGKIETPKHDTKKKSPSKDIEGMYAKVMKKTKLFTNLPSNNSKSDIQLNNNPEMYVSDPDITKEMNIEFANETASPGKVSSNSIQIDNNYETIDKKKRNRTGSFTHKDPGYETIPAEKNRNHNSEAVKSSRMSAPVGTLPERNEIEMEPGYEMLPERPTISLDPGYEVLKQNTNNSDYDPNYEVLRPVDDGYARIMDKARQSHGYSSIKNVRSKVQGDDDDLGCSPLDGYAKIGEKKITNINNNVVIAPNDDNSEFYSNNSNNPPYASLNEVKSNELHRRSFPTYATVQESNGSITGHKTTGNSPNYSTISETQKTTPSTESFNSSENLLLPRPSDTASLTGSDTDPNYESVRYLNVTENPYERLHSEKTSPVSVGSVTDVKITVATPQNKLKTDVGDFFQV
uniref:CSON002858 protein n=1 Tax=Culicoides sonorensis TaxID=179676 RepID=A0A336LB76_CULSO